MKKNFTLFIIFAVCNVTLLQAVVPAGYYYNANGKTKAELKTALSEICKRAQMHPFGTGTDATWSLFYQMDQLTDSSVVDMYSNTMRKFDATNPTHSIKEMHIDHAFARECWGGWDIPATFDMHNLFPADGNTNVSKSYYPLGIVTNPTFDNGVSKVGRNDFPASTGFAFEPADQYKGDFARAYLYIATVYEDMAGSWQSEMMIMDTAKYPGLEPWAIDLLLQWHAQDPVSPKELARNEAIYQIQGNRNPFIDYPNLVDYIWGNDTTSLYYFPQASTPFLYAPHPFDEIDFGGVSQNGNYQQAVTIGGLNLTSNVLLNLAKANQGFSISTTSIDPTAAAAGISLTVTLNATLTGELSDTLYIYQGGLTDTLRIPLKAIVTNEFLLVNTDNIDSDKATIHWAAHPRATNYLIDVFDRDSTAGDLFFYYYACDLLGNNKAIGIYNGTNDTISLSKYELRQQLDGMGSYTNALQLHGTLAPKQCYILAHAGSTDATLVMQADTLIQNNNGINFMNFDGNDAIALYRSGILMDRIGAANETNDWGGNIIMVREGMMNHPQRIFDWREWQLHGITGYSNIKQHQITRGGQLYYERRKYAVGNVTHVEVDDLHPEEYYTCVVYAIVGTDTIRSDNSMQIKTDALRIPLAVEATHITENSFSANWETTAGALNYLLNVFTMTWSGTLTEHEGFDLVLSNGRPLPEGWSSNCYGTFSEQANVGNSEPALKLSTEADFIQSKNYPGPVKTLSFKYNFPTTAYECAFKLEGGYNNDFEAIDTLWYSGSTMQTASYQFGANKEYRAFRWSYINSLGNHPIALDDVEVSYDDFDTTFVIQRRRTEVTNYPVRGLIEGQTYYYNVAAHYCHVPSEYSNVISLVTRKQEVGTGTYQMPMQWYTQPEGIMLLNVEPNSLVRLFNTTGLCLWSGRTTDYDLFIPMSERNIYLVQIVNNLGAVVLKVVK